MAYCNKVTLGVSAIRSDFGIISSADVTNEDVLLLTAIQLNRSHFVEFPPLSTTHKVHTSILSCCSYFESTIHYYWMFHGVRETFLPRTPLIFEMEFSILHNLQE